MSLVLNPTTKVYEADVRSRTMPRLHVSLRTKRKAEAMTRHEAIVQLVTEGHRDLVDQLRRRKLTVEQVTACARDKRSFDTLRERRVWPTLQEAADEYVAALENHPQRAARTAAIAGYELARVLPFEHEGQKLAAMRVDAVPAAAIDALAAHLRTTYAANTTTDTIMRVSGLYTWLRKREAREAREAGRLPRHLHSPVDPETRPRDKPVRERFLGRDEVDCLIAATPEVHRWPVLLGLLAGLRVGEVVHLRPCDVDAETGIITIQARPGWKPKRGKRREVPMCEELRAAHAVQLSRYASEAYLTVGVTGSRKSERILSEQFGVIVERAGLVAGRDTPAGVTFHTLRHTFASHLVMRGVDLYTTAQLLGDTFQTVEKTYARLAPDHKRAAVAKLSGLFQVLAAHLPSTESAETTAEPAREAPVTGSATRILENGSQTAEG